MMIEKDFVYAAGFFDGEGCVYVTTLKHKHYLGGVTLYLALAVGNTNKAVLEWLQETFGGKLYLHKRVERRKPYWRWQLDRAHTTSFLKGVLPYLKIKQEQALLAIEFQSYKFHKGRKTFKRERQEEIRRELQRLKR